MNIIKVTIDIDEFMEEVKIALVNEWQQLALSDDDGEAVYEMIVEVISNFTCDKKNEYAQEGSQGPPPSQ